MVTDEQRMQRLRDACRRVIKTCAHLGGETGEVVSCPSCHRSVRIKTFKCEVYGQCTPVKKVEGIACCSDRCPSFSRAKPELEGAVRWTCGVTTVPERKETLLLRTLKSLAAAGFGEPRLFVDGDDHPNDWKLWARDRGFHLEVTARSPRVRAYGNWILSLHELYVRHPKADRYAIFQDDMVAVANLRGYLDSCEYPVNGYWNLYTFPDNQRLCPRDLTVRREPATGWYESNQRGLGAVALVFNRAAVLKLLTSAHMAERPMDDDRGWKAIDGGVVTALAKAKVRELVHNPSLVQHTGERSTIGNDRHPRAESFPGEEFDARRLHGCR